MTDLPAQSVGQCTWRTLHGFPAASLCKCTGLGVLWQVPLVLHPEVQQVTPPEGRIATVGRRLLSLARYCRVTCSRHTPKLWSWWALYIFTAASAPAPRDLTAVHAGQPAPGAAGRR